MLWLKGTDKNGDEYSHAIVSCNTAFKNDMHELWVTRPGGKSLFITKSKNKDEVLEIKEAIDYAIENGETMLRLT